jgi:hypothetical protein
MLVFDRATPNQHSDRHGQEIACASLVEYLMMLIIVDKELMVYELGSILRSTMPKEHRPHVIIQIATDGGPLGLGSGGAA